MTETAVLSEAALTQRVLVRMLYDPVFRDAVYADPTGLLEPLGVPTARIAQIVAHDVRAFSVDPWRGHRAVTAAMREAAVSVLAMTRLGVQSGDHLAFISSPAFHRCVMGRGLLIGAFFDYLEAGFSKVKPATRRERQAVVVMGAMIRLERAIAEVRRPALKAVGPGRITLGQARALELPAGASTVWARARAALGADPVAALVSGSAEAKRALAALFGDENLGSGVREHVLVDGTATAHDHGIRQGGEADPANGNEGDADPGHEPVVSFVGESLVILIKRAEAGASRAELLAVAEREGATPLEAEEIVSELVADGLLLE